MHRAACFSYWRSKKGQAYKVDRWQRVDQRSSHQSTITTISARERWQTQYPCTDTSMDSLAAKNAIAKKAYKAVSKQPDNDTATRIDSRNHRKHSISSNNAHVRAILNNSGSCLYRSARLLAVLVAEVPETVLPTVERGGRVEAGTCGLVGRCQPAPGIVGIGTVGGVATGAGAVVVVVGARRVAYLFRT